jgi:two-component system alkaline phosphatase synthesis response regulator PhoP
VLVVDDEAGVRESIRMILRGQCEVETAESVDAGLEALRKGDIDLVLLDLVMPGRNGLALLEALAKQAKAPPVLVLTATRDRGAAERALALGAVDCFRKPFAVEALRARVRELIS